MAKKTDSKRASRPLAAVILAAGEGKRMRSGKAKVIHEIGGRPLLGHVLDAAQSAGADRFVVIVGHQEEQVRAVVGDRAECAVQAEQLGTGHAVLQAKRALRGFDGDVLVLCGDVPLITPKTIRSLVRAHRRGGGLATVLGMVVDDPTGYGRILGDPDGSVRIVEHTDATEDERMVDEINTGTYCFDAKFLFKALGALGSDNAQGEYYLTDLLEAASKKGRAKAVMLENDYEGLGINSRGDLAQAEMVFQGRLIDHWMERGVTFLDPGSAYVDAGVRIGRDTVIGPGVRLSGSTVLGEGCVLDGMCHLIDTRVGPGVHLRWGVVTNGAKIGEAAVLGPYSHLRPQAELGANVHVGNFVEVKKSRLGPNTKANHLAYIGDAVIGKDTNIGAGTITCNYDGFAKHKTVIGDRVQIGSDTQLVAPVKLGNDVFVAAGSTVTDNVRAGSLAYNDKRQKVRSGWVAAFRSRIQRKKG